MILKPAHSRMTVAVPTKKREAASYGDVSVGSSVAVWVGGGAEGWT